MTLKCDDTGFCVVDGSGRPPTPETQSPMTTAFEPQSIRPRQPQGASAHSHGTGGRDPRAARPSVFNAAANVGVAAKVQASPAPAPASVPVMVAAQADAGAAAAAGAPLPTSPLTLRPVSSPIDILELVRVQGPAVVAQAAVPSPTQAPAFTQASQQGPVPSERGGAPSFVGATLSVQPPQAQAAGSSSSSGQASVPQPTMSVEQVAALLALVQNGGVAQPQFRSGVGFAGSGALPDAGVGIPGARASGSVRPSWWMGSDADWNAMSEADQQTVIQTGLDRGLTYDKTGGAGGSSTGGSAGRDNTATYLNTAAQALNTTGTTVAAILASNNQRSVDELRIQSQERIRALEIQQQGTTSTAEREALERQITALTELQTRLSQPLTSANTQQAANNTGTIVAVGIAAAAAITLAVVLSRPKNNPAPKRRVAAATPAGRMLTWPYHVGSAR